MDPYTDPKYEMQIQKHRAKEEREAARAQQAKDKAEK